MRPARLEGWQKVAAYNRKMRHALNPIFSTLQEWFAPAVMERTTLWANHVLASEAVATARLMPHAGKSLRILWPGAPAFLPPPPPMSWRITPAGLLEWRGLLADGADDAAAAAADLTLRIDASRPALLLSQALSGAFPEASIDGDAALAADVAWLTQNLRWDLAADLDRVFPSAVAQGIGAGLSMLAKALRAALARALARSLD